MMNSNLQTQDHDINKKNKDTEYILCLKKILSIWMKTHLTYPDLTALHKYQKQILCE